MLLKMSKDPFCVSPTRCFRTVLAKEKWHRHVQWMVLLLLPFFILFFFYMKNINLWVLLQYKVMRCNVDCDHVPCQTTADFFWFTVMAIFVEKLWLCKLMSVIILLLFDYVPINNKHWKCSAVCLFTSCLMNHTESFSYVVTFNN